MKPSPLSSTHPLSPSPNPLSLLLNHTMHFATNLISPALLFSLTFFFSLSAAAAAANPSPPNLVLPSDAVGLLTFKSKADTDNKLHYTLTDRFDYCQWPGVKCVQGRVVRFVLQSSGLRGTFPANSLSRLDQLRILVLRNNSLTGPIPDLSGLVNLKTLFLNNNYFSGFFPPSLLSLHRIRTLDLARNSLSGPIPAELTVLDRLNYLRLDWNRFNGTIPQLNQTSLEVFNVSHNNLTGPIPVNPTLSKFPNSSFSSNPNLCGEILNKICRSPFFDSPSDGDTAPAPLLQNAASQGLLLSPPSPKKHNRRVGVILGLIVGFLILIALILSIFTFYKRRIESKSPPSSPAINSVAENTTNAMQMPIVITEVETTSKEKKLQVPHKSGHLIFSEGETAMYSLEQLMRASAELLGRGTVGTTYKAVMDNQLIVTVKRLDAGKTAITSGDAFERHMEAVGGLRHPNLVPVRAYFQAKTERLVIYDYQTNGSLFNLIHGSRSTRAKPLHWTSCLKIAEDVALGLAYIHQASKLIHGNLKSSNILLGPEFEACLTDYCLSTLAASSYSNDDPDSAGYKAPEIRKSGHHSTSKSDVYAFGVLLLELLSGKPPSQHPFLVPTDMSDWVKAMRDDEGVEENRLGMLVEVAGICSLTSPEQRPGMRHVLKMIQEIKETAMLEDNATEAYTGYS